MEIIDLYQNKLAQVETADTIKEKARDSSHLYKLTSFYSFRDCFYGK